MVSFNFFKTVKSFRSRNWKRNFSEDQSCAVAGFKGQVGSAIYRIIKEARMEVYGIEKDFSETPLDRADFLHICIPFDKKKDFIRAVSKLVRKSNPRNIIIHSTVLPGITRAVWLKTGLPTAYSPIRGQHDSLYRDIKRYIKYLSPLPSSSSDIFKSHLENLGLKVFSYNKAPEELELVKILDVCQYAISIGWAQEAERILRNFGFDFYHLYKDFQAEHVKFYPEKRADIFPGFAGGHCVRQNARLLDRIYKSDFIKAFLKSNSLKAKELGIEDEESS